MEKKRHAWLPDFGVQGWCVTLAAFCFYFCGNIFDGALNAVLNVYNLTYGWSTVQMTSAVTLGGWLSILGIVIFGAVCKKKGAKFTSVIGLFGAAIFICLVAMAQNYMMFAIGTVGFIFFCTGFMVIGVGQFGANWFPRKTGMYMGLATCGMTASAASLNYVIIKVTENFGVSAFMYGVAVACVIVAVLVLAFIHNYPEEVGCYPDNDKTFSREAYEKEKAALEELKKSSPYTMSKVLRTKETWMVALGWSLPMLVATGSIGQLALTFVEFGHDFMFGIMILTTAWPVGIIGNYLCGVIDDKWGIKIGSIIVVAAELLGILIILFAGSNANAAVLGAGLLLFAMSGCSNITVSMSTTVFGRVDFENFWPVISVVYKFLIASSPLLVAAIAAAANYHMVLSVLAAICVVAIVIMALTTGKCITGDKTMDKKLY